MRFNYPLWFCLWKAIHTQSYLINVVFSGARACAPATWIWAWSGEVLSGCYAIVRYAVLAILHRVAGITYTQTCMMKFSQSNEFGLLLIYFMGRTSRFFFLRPKRNRRLQCRLVITVSEWNIKHGKSKGGMFIARNIFVHSFYPCNWLMISACYT